MASGESRDESREQADRSIRPFQHSQPEAQQKSLKDLLGLIDTGGRPPTDAECRAILEEELLRKYTR